VIQKLLHIIGITGTRVFVDRLHLLSMIIGNPGDLLKYIAPNYNRTRSRLVRKALGVGGTTSYKQPAFRNRSENCGKYFES
jgi:hypothetical protein